MAVSTGYTALSYAGTGAQTAFVITWQFFDAADLVVTLIDSSGVETSQTITTHYSVTGGRDSDGLPATGTLTMVTAPASGASLRILRSTPRVQSSTWTKSGPFSAKTLEAALDREMLCIQELVVSVSGGIGGDVMTLNTAGATNYWDAQSNVVRNVANATASTDAINYGQLLSMVSDSPVTATTATESTTISTAGNHVIMANGDVATVTIGAGIDWCMVSRSSQSVANVTVVSAGGPSVTIEGDGTGVVINAKIGPVLFITDPDDANNYITVTPQIETWGSGSAFTSATVAGLAAITPTAGLAYFASDGRKNGEEAASGTGVMVFGDGSAWRAVDTGATVAA